MRNVFITAIAALAFAGAAVAQEAAVVGPVITGEIAVDIAENAAGDYGATTSFDLGVSAGDVAFGGIDFVATPGSNVTVDGWHIGTTLGVATLTFGDQDGVFVEAESDFATTEVPAMTENLQVAVGDAAVAIGFTDVGNDITDVSNVQGAYTLSVGVATVTASADYNLNSEDYLLGGRAVTEGLLDNVALGGTVTYGNANEVFAFEADAAVYGITAYVNGDQNDAFQNVGAGYEYNLSGLTLGADVNYNVDTKDVTPSLAASFNF